MSLVSPSDVRALVNTSLSENNLQAVIDRIEAQITDRIGPPQDESGTVTHTVTKPGEGTLLFMPTEIASVVSVVEESMTLDAGEYQVWAGGVIERLPAEFSVWGRRVTVTYRPADDRMKRSQVIIDLVRLTIERTAMKHESIAGEYAYDAPDWEDEFRKALRRLTFASI